jgi:hypothetical protein
MHAIDALQNPNSRRALKRILKWGLDNYDLPLNTEVATSLMAERGILI